MGHRRPESLQCGSAQRKSSAEGAFSYSGFERSDRVFLTEFEGNDVVRLLHAGKLTGNDGCVAAVGTTGCRRRLIADEFCAARRAGVAFHARLCPVRALRLGSFALVGLCCRLLLRLCSGLCGLFILLLIECLDLLDRIGRAAVIAFKFSGRANKMQRTGTRGTFVICDLVCHANLRLL